MLDTNLLKERYKEIFGQEAALLVKSPGRINIIGEHTDYNEGFVLPAAIDKAIYVAVGKRDDDLISLFAEDFKQSYSVKLVDIAPTSEGWPNYILGVVQQIKDKGLSIGGFNLYIDGDIPLGAGLSSSAAVECATGYALNSLFHLDLDRVTIAKIGQLAEHTYAGVMCGIMDQFASVLSKADHVIKLDCRDLSYTYVPLDLGNYEIVLLNTNVKHALASSAYNDRRNACEHAVKLIQSEYPEVKSLRDVNLNQLELYVKPVDPEAYVKSKYVIEENERLGKACQALEKGDIEELGRQMFLAHTAISEEFQVSCPELDFLVEQAKSFSQVKGARMMGGGFGGCTINIVEKGFAAQLVEIISPSYKAQFNLELTPIFVSIANGTELVY
ncbi:galactokinase [Sphingobacterium sp. DK4209]|uniref:Galactokinase n=1 Tax=Sphingobacterium zhuxiongii TaxID=2662364 RepID=A0A5Q0QCG1_9SPHI|nr:MULTISPECIES: galactokinase [unclassified Sphingobacterium]MVZ66488.1 galactokinase [Sphingobacterium sp. DK4209]QGA27857.1 galactokinase [Sphingobacterium sp. dk4302]